MTKKKWSLIGLSIVLFMGGLFGLLPDVRAEQTLSFWNMPFVTQEVSPEYVSKWEKDINKALPGHKVDKFYGPGKYKDQRDKFLLQAKSGTPDVIEGLLEDTAVYVQKGLIEPLDTDFKNWPESDQFIESTLAPLRINGKLYGLPYNTNARAMVYRKDIFEKHNLSIPQTWDELIQTARKITELTAKKTHGFFVCTEVGDPRAAQEFISWYYQVSKRKNLFDVTDGKITFNGTVEQFEKVLTLYDELFKEGDFKYHNYLITVDKEFNPKLNWETQGYKWTTLDNIPSPRHPGLEYLLSHLKSNLEKQSEKQEEPPIVKVKDNPHAPWGSAAPRQTPRTSHPSRWTRASGSAARARAFATALRHCGAPTVPIDGSAFRFPRPPSPADTCVSPPR